MITTWIWIPGLLVPIWQVCVVALLLILTRLNNGLLTQELTNILSNSFTLFDVFVVPDFNVNLLSVHKVCKDSNREVVSDENSCMVQDSLSKQKIEIGNENGGLYHLNNSFLGIKTANSNFSKCYVSKHTWRCRLGHPIEHALNKLKSQLDLNNVYIPPYEVCHKAKQTRESFLVSNHVSIKLGELIHIDVWGPYRVTSSEGFKYFLTIVDDFSIATWVYLMNSKDEVFHCFTGFSTLLSNMFEVKIKNVRSDNGTDLLITKRKIF